MSKIKFWTFWAVMAALLVKVAYSMMFGFDSGFHLSDSLAIWFNNLGVWFGLTGFILWVGRRVPYSDALGVSTLAIGFLSYLCAYFWDKDGVFYTPGVNLIIMFWPFGILSLVELILNSQWVKKFTGKKQTAKEKQFLSDYFFLTILNMSLGMATTETLRIITYIFPNTIDFDVFKIDAAFHDFAAYVYILNEKLPPILQTLVSTTYSLLSLVLLLCVGLVLAERKDEKLNIIRVLVVPFLVAFPLYWLNSVSGPIYAFTAENYPHNLAAMNTIPVGAQFIFPAARNGMPSMHLTGALLICLVTACLNRKIYFYCACVFAAVTFFATMALGEHYLLDLIVAAPFALVLGTALLNPRGWQFRQRKVWWGCVFSFVIWELFLLLDRVFLINHAWFVWLLSLMSVVLAGACFRAFIRHVWVMPAAISASDDEKEAVKTIEKEEKYPHWVVGVFVASGFAGLLYEVIFAKNLGVTFGGTSLAAYTVMATYMGGMALGTWLGGIIADRVQSPLKWYAAFEGTIGLYALLTPTLFKLIRYIYVYLATDIRPDAPVLTVWRVLLGVIVLGIPTILMGTTLPIMFKYLRRYLSERGKVIAGLYTANIMGAAVGALLGGYVVLPVLGLLSATRLAALISLMISLYTLDKIKQQQMPLPTVAFAAGEAGKSTLDNKASYSLGLTDIRRLGIAALLLVTVGGVVTLALEIVNMHMLAVVAGNSVYAFSLMLATFLLGLGLGAVAYNYLQRCIPDALIAAFAQLGIFFTIVISAFQWNNLVQYFASFAYMEPYFHFDFGARELIRASVCAVIMMPPAFFIGFGYPATMALSSEWLKQKNNRDATGVGIAGLFNTLGNIVGVLLAGFVLLNWLGSNRLLLLLAVVSLGLGLMMLFISRSFLARLFPTIKYRILFYCSVSVLTVFSVWKYPSVWSLDALTTGANVYFVAVDRGHAIDSLESIDGGLTTVNRFGDMLTLLTNGKFQGNNAQEGEVKAQRAVALTPLLHTPERDSVLVIGYGTGNSAHVLREQGFKHMDIAELSKDIVSIADKYFGEINGHISRQKNVSVYYTDGRNFLLTQNKKYNLISMEISSIWFAGAANLYNREFYQLAKKRLTKNGVLQQWVQVHHMRPVDLLYIINTIHQEFKYVWLYFSGGQGILVASDSPQADKLYNLQKEAVTSEQLNAEEKQLNRDEVLSPKDVDFISKKMLLPQYLTSTDNNLYLEYATPKGNAVDFDAEKVNLKMLEELREERLKADKKAGTLK